MDFAGLVGKIKSTAVASIGAVTAMVTTAMITFTSTGITVETADVTNVSNSNGYFLTSSFEILKFLPTLAVLAGGLYVLNKVFSFVPKPSSGL